MNGGLRLLLGPDRPRKLQRIQQLERELGVGPLDRHQADGADANTAALVALCRQQPAMGRARLIVVDRADRLSSQAAEALLQHAEAIAQTACVVLLADAEFSVRHPFARAGASLPVERFAARESPAAKPFALVEALGRRDAAGALEAMQDQVLAGKEPLELLSLVSWQVQRWVLVKRLLAAGLSPEQAGTGLKAWQVERICTEIAGRSLDDLQQLLARCWRVERDIKRGRVLPAVEVEALVLEVCLGEPVDAHREAGL
ncbi:MAG: hypothetical protein HY601_02895 [Candidatus Omnitrophica bacterium]|nr:hypothetical protein [Candidatus Omnitrophota bacterium]